MDKILKLANEYNLIKENGFVVDDGGWEYLEYDEGKEPMLTYRNSGTYATGDDAEAILISKYYGFVKRLVDISKLDLLQLDARIALSEYIGYERVLMALQIQYDPIRFLLSILKEDV